ncbi:MAG: Peroxide operon regulator [Firmicutes bacterium ADurb.Bin300]|nr:MAG: Peroxide operon regulator [Firmicutes bacterium ADurb.Bin300]HOD02862.1 transcriptional repressor [Clostridiales bacterium]
MDINKKSAEVLTRNNIKPSYQRVMIYSYLASNFIHPTAQQIYESLKGSILTLSKTTVYNTLRAFYKANLIREITIEENEIRYEFNMHDHGHFKCEQCGEIYDFKINNNYVNKDELSGFIITDKNVFFKGCCKNCLKKR